MELNLLIRRPWDGEIILDYWGDPGVVSHKGLYGSGRGRQKRSVRCDAESKAGVR